MESRRPASFSSWLGPVVSTGGKRAVKTESPEKVINSLPNPVSPVFSRNLSFKPTIQNLVMDYTHKEGGGLIQSGSHQVRGTVGATTFIPFKTDSSNKSEKAIMEPGDLHHMMAIAKISKTSTQANEIVLYHKQEQIEELQRTLKSHEEQIVTSETQLALLQDRTSQATDNTASLKSDLINHQKLVQLTLQRTQLSLQHQAAILNSHSQLTKQLVMKQGGNGDAMFEAGFLLLSFYLVETPMVRYVITIMSTRWKGTSRHKKWFPQALRLIFIYHMFKLFKNMSSKMHLSQGFWGTMRWITGGILNFGQQMTKILSFGGTDSLAEPGKLKNNSEDTTCTQSTELSSSVLKNGLNDIVEPPYENIVTNTMPSL